MRTKDELEKLYATFTDRQLLDIINEKAQYTHNAIQAALGEMQRREIRQEQIEDYIEELAMEEEVMEQIAQVELTLLEKAMFYFLWLLPFVNFANRMNYAERGQKAKVKQSKVFSISGFLTFLLVAVLAGIFDHSGPTSIILWIFFFVPIYTVEKILKAASNNRIKQGL